MNMLFLLASLWASFVNHGGIDRPTAGDRWQAVLARTSVVINDTDLPVMDRYSQRFGCDHRRSEGEVTNSYLVCLFPVAGGGACT